MQVLGLCRFSVPVEGGFQVGHRDIDERRDFLYDPARLAERFLWFERVLLPSLRAQTDRNFRLVLLCGEDLPRPWRDRLMDLVAGTPQVRPVFRAPDNHRDLCRRVMAEAVEPGSDVLAEFRLDDDDAVAVNYVARIRSDFLTYATALWSTFGRAFVDQSRGLLLDTTGAYRIAPLVVPHLTAGLTIYLPPTTLEHVIDFPHHRILTSMPGLNLQDEIMFMRGVHGRNDSGGGPKPTGDPFMPARAADVAQRRFGIDLPRFAVDLAALRSQRMPDAQTATA